MKIEIDLDELGFHYDDDGDPIGRQTITDAIIEAAAARVLTKNPDLAKAVGSKLDAVATAQINDQIASVFAEPIQRRKAWGDEVGEPTTVKEIIRGHIEDYFQSPATKNDRYNSNGALTPGNLSQLIDREVQNVINSELRDTVKEARAEVTKQIKARTATAIAKAISA